MSKSIDKSAVDAFAKVGICLVPVPVRDYVWTHDVYTKVGPASKDIEIRIRKGDYMGEVVHRVTVKNVSYLDAAKVADGVLQGFLGELNSGVTSCQES